MTHFDENRPTIRPQCTESGQREWFNTRKPICSVQIRIWIVCIFGISWPRSRPSLKCVFTSIGRGRFMSVQLTFISYICIHFHFGFVFCFCFIFGCAFVKMWGYSARCSMKFLVRLFGSWNVQNVQNVDAWWLIRNCAASEIRNRARALARSHSRFSAFAVDLDAFIWYLCAWKVDVWGYELEVVNHGWIESNERQKEKHIHRGREREIVREWERDRRSSDERSNECAPRMLQH